MSNQVYANGLNRYFPAGAQTDRLTLTKNNPVVPGTSPAYGNVLKNVNGVGSGVFWGDLNGATPITTGTVVNYTPFQNPQTEIGRAHV